ncbi:MAG TPA: hypothetical protein VFY38_00530 [Pseudonocardia sp.]|nr:hypothetical protein [Pseudonocardia sp.]
MDRPLVPRARDLLEAGVRTSTHRAAVAAGALLAVTTVLGSNALGDSTIISGVGVDDAADAGPAAVPSPADPLPLAAADAPVREVMAALESAGTPVRAVLVGTPVGPALSGSGPVLSGSGPLLSGSGTVSGAGIVTAALRAPAAEARTRSGSSSSSGDDGATDDRSTASRSDDSRRDSDGDSDRDTSRRDRADRDGRGSGSGSDDVTPSRPVVPLPSANPDLPPPVTGSDIVDGSLGGSGSSADGDTDGGSGSDTGSGSGSGSDAEGGSDGEDTGADSGNTAGAEEQDGGGENASAGDNSSSDNSSSDSTSDDSTSETDTP